VIVQNGELLIWSSVQDISDRKQYEAQLHQTNEELSRATRLKDEFLANMSHELRTPLNSILGMAESLQENIFGEVNAAQIKAIQLIERSGLHLLELINDILDVAKIESGQMELDMAPCDIAALCESSLAFVKQQALKKGIQLQIKIPQRLPELLIDERRIRQVLINLLNNAVKFTLQGGRITLEVTKKTSDNPELIGSNFEKQLQITVIDTGIGISPENIQKLFKPFIQIDSALNRQYQGTGLGLALVKRVVEIHGGEVSLTSEVGVGSRFVIELPYIDNSPSSSETSTSSSNLAALQSESSSPKLYTAPLILLADDNESNIMTISSYLSAKNYRLVLARDGAEAIALTEINNPDLILMDVQMPVIDGLESIRRIRANPKFANTPIIAITALAMESDRQKCLDAGATEYISKPIKLKLLANSIQQLTNEPENKYIDRTI
jgi:signal transduction histidine kinase/ActR/RegA family two-component response regulator